MKQFFKTASLIFGLAVFLFTAQGCNKDSYPADQVKESILKICREEYGIQDIEVKIAGETIGVFLPLGKLFAADFKEAAVTGKVRNLETLFEPSPEALEKVEDVLFSVSRVILSTNRPFKFYVLEATDVDKTGMQLVVSGYVEDMKRVRFWDISRNEYRKRLIHDLKMNRAVLWHKVVRQFFKDLSEQPVEIVQKKYFGPEMPTEVLKALFNKAVITDISKTHKIEWKIVDIRSAAVRKNEILVYTKVQAPAEALQGKAKQLQFIFVVGLREEKERIVRIIPFQYQEKDGTFKEVSFPKELDIEDNLNRWETEFDLKEIDLGDFLAQQMSRRVQGIANSDERIQNTFRDVKMEFTYHKEDQPYFSLDMEVALKDFNHYSKGSLVHHEDMVYLLNLVFKEFADVMRSYQFGNYEALQLQVAQDPSPWTVSRDEMELFRRKKIDIQSLFSATKI